MTTEKWQLYSQTGVDGPEYGVRIRTGYTVVGFQKEDAQAIVAWQNASIQPEGDIMEKAKALRNAALPRQTYSIPGQTGYGNPSLSKGWDFSAVDELVRVVVLELIAEVEAKRNLALDMLTKNKDLLDRAMRAEAEVERLRSHHIQIMGKIRAWILNDCAEACRGFDWRDEEISRQREEIDAKDARIKELEEANRNIDKRRDEMAAFIERLEAAFLEAKRGAIYFQDAPNTRMMLVDLWDVADKKAREALEIIKEGGKDE